MTPPDSVTPSAPTRTIEHCPSLKATALSRIIVTGMLSWPRSLAICTPVASGRPSVQTTLNLLPSAAAVRSRV